jgi:hypothetical protein
MTSGPALAGNGVMIRTGFAGHSEADCARACEGSAHGKIANRPAAASGKNERRFMCWILL